MMPDDTQVTQRSKATPGLYIVATPIGNLADITLRALEVLKQMDFIACEDTRVSRRLLEHYGVTAPLWHYDDHSREGNRKKLLRHIEEGKSIALISDAGTPLISDPGYKLVRQAQTMGLYVTTLPGASSLTAALTLAGLPTNRFVFEGFLPPKQVARKKVLQHLKALDATLVFFESARRLQEALEDILTVLGEREVAVVREISKLFEETKRDSVSQLLAHYEAHGLPKGEVVLVVAPPEATVMDENAVQHMLAEALKTLSVKDAAHTVAEATGLPRKEVYRLALGLKGKEGGHEET